MIQIQAIGNIGRDAEIKTINERKYFSFSLASTEKHNGEKTTTWISVLYPYNELLSPYLLKGKQVFVSGRMTAKLYQSNGNTGMDLSVFADTLQLCGNKSEESTSQQASVQPEQTVIKNTDDLLPF